MSPKTSCLTFSQCNKGVKALGFLKTGQSTDHSWAYSHPESENEICVDKKGYHTKNALNHMILSIRGCGIERFDNLNMHKFMLIAKGNKVPEEFLPEDKKSQKAKKK